jgi:hypothetical protein
MPKNAVSNTNASSTSTSINYTSVAARKQQASIQGKWKHDLFPSVAKSETRGNRSIHDIPLPVRGTMPLLTFRVFGQSNGSNIYGQSFRSTIIVASVAN